VVLERQLATVPPGNLIGNRQPEPGFRHGRWSRGIDPKARFEDA
jgi:hypothetical protein